MKTNSKQVRNLIDLHILECVTNENGNNYNNIIDAKIRVKNEFTRVANNPYNLKRFPNDQIRFSNYLLGLPFNFHYYNDDIKDFLNSLGINPKNKIYLDDKMQHLYHYLIFKNIFN